MPSARHPVDIWTDEHRFVKMVLSYVTCSRQSAWHYVDETKPREPLRIRF